MEFISQVLVPYFQKMKWVCKKEMDFIDWVSILKLKELGLHHSKEGPPLPLFHTPPWKR